MKSMKDYIEVTVALIQEGGSFLIGKRPKGKAFAGRWEFPGGKVEHSETPDESLLREIHEELGVRITIHRPFYTWSFKYPEGEKFQFHSYLCTIPKGKPHALWHDEIAWVRNNALSTVDLLEADRELLSSIEEQGLR